jgi:hypothetical protein
MYTFLPLRSDLLVYHAIVISQGLQWGRLVASVTTARVSGSGSYAHFGPTNRGWQWGSARKPTIYYKPSRDRSCL